MVNTLIISELRDKMTISTFASVMWWIKGYDPKAEQEGKTPEELVDGWIYDTIQCRKLGNKIPFKGLDRTRPGMLAIIGNFDRGVEIFQKFILFLYENGQMFNVEKEAEGYGSGRYQNIRSIAYIDGIEYLIRIREKPISKAEVIKHKGKAIPVKFMMEICDYSIKKHFYETNSLALEDRFPEIYEWLKEDAKKEIEWKESCKRREEEREAKEKAQKELENRIMVRAFYADSIKMDIRKIEKAQSIRQFCKRLEQEEVSKKGRLSEYTQMRIEVAHSIADWLDPFVDHVDELLSKKYKPEDFI